MFKKLILKVIKSMNKYHFISIISIALIFVSCKKEQDPYLISKASIGLLTDSTKVKELKSAFPNDSVVNYEGNTRFNVLNKIEVYETGGKLLLALSPEKIGDSISTITTVKIEDPRFKTDKGISTLSSFKDIENAYKINKIDNLINSIVISVNEINAQFAIDKKELPANLRYDMNIQIEASQIPDNAKIKYFFINWD